MLSKSGFILVCEFFAINVTEHLFMFSVLDHIRSTKYLTSPVLLRAFADYTVPLFHMSSKSGARKISAILSLFALDQGLVYYPRTNKR